ncbi:MAG: carboxylesterase family protein [Acidobacteriota bacterium]|nr:carboxylesterase family protein [Acidobacteriota bacterium]
MRRVVLCTVICAWAALTVPVLAQEEVRVEIDTGALAGVRQGGITMFKGIPYAAPPVGPLRWGPPQPVAPWARVRAARRYGPVARQPGAGGPGMVASEDCLYLNIWRPAQEGESRPVMVFIHGGGFTTGSGSEPLYDGIELAKQGVVVVTFNYRLGVIGFLAHPQLTAESTHESSGNYGLLDQVAALEWVQRNIHQFGGDPARVTIFGESAGGRAVSLLMVSPLTDGLFHRAAAQSGAVRGVSTLLAVREQAGVRLAEAVGCAGRPDPLRCLRARPFEELAIAAARFDTGPIVDGWLIPEDPRVVYAEGRQHDVPMIIGGNADEGTFSTLGRRTPITTVADYEAYVRGSVATGADEVLARYRAGADDEVYQTLNRFDTDRGVARHARQHGRWVSAGRAPTFVYLFARVSPHHRWTRLGATHTAELPYLFGNLQFAARQGRLSTLELADRRLSQAMMRYWTRFAETGDPNGDGRPVWPAYADDETLLVLDGEITTGGWPRADGLDLLDRLFADQRAAGVTDASEPR